MATTITSLTDDLATTCLAVASDMLRRPVQNMWIDYDQEADVLYMSFRRPQNATKTIEMDDDIDAELSAQPRPLRFVEIGSSQQVDSCFG
jgi:hypothetical protein